MDAMFDKDSMSDFEEKGNPVPLWMQVDGNEKDPLDISKVKTEEHNGSVELQSMLTKVENKQSLSILEDVKVKIEDIHFQDYDRYEYVDQNTSTMLDSDQIKSEMEFYSEDFETKPQPIVRDLVAYMKEVEPSCSYTHNVKQELGTVTQDITEEHSLDHDVQSDSLAPSLPHSDQLEGIEMHRETELYIVSGGIAAPSCGAAGVNFKYKICNCMCHCNRNYKGHMIYKDINLFHCAYCVYTTMNKHFLISHVDKHIHKSKTDKILNKYHYKSAVSSQSKCKLSLPAAKRSFGCNLCRYKSAYSSNLKQHLLTHTGERKFLCNICQSKFSQSSNLKTHMLTHTGDKKFICNICQSTFAHSHNLKNHMLTHTGEKKFICTICQSKFTQSSNLKTHMSTHTGDKKFICNICQSKFAHSHSLKNHMLTHTGDKKFICTICQSKFTQSSNLKTHMLIHTGDKKFICNICRSKFARSGDLKTHMLIHTGERKFICNICQSRFVLSAYLKKHMKVHSKK